MVLPLQWHPNEHDDVSNHQPHDYLLNCLLRHRLKQISKLCSLVFMRGIHQWPVNSPHKGPVTWKMFPFDDVIMIMPKLVNLCNTWWIDFTFHNNSILDGLTSQKLFNTCVNGALTKYWWTEHEFANSNYFCYSTLYCSLMRSFLTYFVLVHKNIYM